VKVVEILLKITGGANTDQMMFMVDKGVLGFMYKLTQQREKQLRKMGRTGMWHYVKSLFLGLLRSF